MNHPKDDSGDWGRKSPIRTGREAVAASDSARGNLPAPRFEGCGFLRASAPRPRAYIQIYTGDGKGKTTAAVGLAVRALGAGLKVLLVQFLKPHPSSEWRALRRLPGLALKRFGPPHFIRSPQDAAGREAVRQGLAVLESAWKKPAFDLVIADELCTAVSLGLIGERRVLDWLAARPAGIETILTGRGATRALCRAADLVTEMREKKHYWRAGVRARRGIEF